MATQTFLLISGLALTLGGAIQAIASIAHLNNQDPNAVKSNMWVPLQVAFGFAYLFIGFGLGGVYLRQGEQSGIIGLVGFILALLGSLLTMPTSFMWAFVAPYLAKQDSYSKAPIDLLGANGQIPGIFKLLLAYIFLLMPGFILLGIATIRAGVFPSLAGWLILVGIIISQPGNMVAKLAFLRNVGGVLFGAGLTWLGIVLVSG